MVSLVFFSKYVHKKNQQKFSLYTGGEREWNLVMGAGNECILHNKVSNTRSRPKNLNQFKV